MNPLNSANIPNPLQDGSAVDKLTREETKTLKTKRHFLQVWMVVGAILLTGVFVYLLNILAVPVGIMVWSLIIVFCLRGPVSFFEKLGINRLIGSTIAYVAMFVGIGIVVALLCSPAVGLGAQFADLLKSIPNYVTSITAWGNDFYSQYANILQNDVVNSWINDALKALSDWASNLARESATGVVAVGTTVMNSFMVVGFSLVVGFWILMELPDLGRECKRLIGTKHAEDMEMFHVTLTRVMGGYIKGTVLQCVVIGVGCGLVFGIIGVPNYAALGGICGLLNIIPIVGPWLGGALAAIVGVFVSPWIALIALVATIGVQQIVYTFVSPKIMANSVDVHPALTILALMAGSAIGGAMSGLLGSLVGMLASIPAIAVSKAIFVYYFEKKTGRRLVAEDGVFFQGTPNEGGIDPILDATSPHPDISSAFAKVEEKKAEGKRTGIHRKP
ncbi:MAG: AI-2E family transporter [Raoultibacter sp.]